MKFYRLSYFLMLTLGLSACSATTKITNNLLGNHVQTEFEGKLLESQRIQEFKEVKDALVDPTLEADVDINANHTSPSFKTSRIHAPEVIDYLRSLSTQLLTGWDGEQINFDIYLSSNNRYGAMAERDGNIYINIGMLSAAKDKHEVAFILAHELSHLLLRHHARQDKIEAQKEAVQLVASSVIAVNVAKDISIEEVNGKKTLDYSPTDQRQSNISKSMVYTYLLNGLTDGVLDTAWQRQEEEEADLLAVDLLIKTGFTPKGMAQALQHLSDMEKQDKEQNKDRVAKLQAKQNDELKAALASFDSNEISNELTKSLTGQLDSAIESVIDHFKSTHGDAATRRKETIKYIKERYQNTLRNINDVPNAERAKEWEIATNKMQLPDLVQAYEYLNQAKLALEAENYDNALSLARKSQTQLTQYHPAQRELMFNIRRAQGFHSKANQNLVLIKHWEHASELLFIEMINHHMSQKEFEKAFSFIEKGEVVLSTSRPFALQKVNVLIALGKQSEAEELLKKCSGFEEVKQACAFKYAQLTGEEVEVEEEPFNILDKLNLFTQTL